MKSIFGKIWAVYAVIVFFAIFIVVFPLHLISILLFPKSGKRARIWVYNKLYSKLFFMLTLIKVDVKGKELLDKNQAYIIISNHKSLIDFMLNTLPFPGIYQYLIKKELTKIPAVGYVLGSLAVAVDRKDKSSTRDGLNQLKETLQEGLSVFLYPEGTRNKTDQLLQPFKMGAFKMAIETQTPIAMHTVLNIDEVISGTSYGALLPGRVKVVWSKPFETKGLTLDDVEDLAQRAWEEMHSLLEEYQKRG